MAILQVVMVAMISLNGSNWVAADNSHQSVQFSGQQIFGNAGCNQFNGTYNQTESGLMVGRLATTRMACRKEIMLSEKKFLQQIEDTKFAEMTASELVLKDIGGVELIRLNRKQPG
jgi:putative lipoprotein